ncbi:hypothetical protein NM1482_2137 [Neisseria meningitidis NM1482]|nr:hypothetical protein NM1482_2137 [Neisseria meningitidis NM1482]
MIFLQEQDWWRSKESLKPLYRKGFKLKKCRLKGLSDGICLSGKPIIRYSALVRASVRSGLSARPRLGCIR